LVFSEDDDGISIDGTANFGGTLKLKFEDGYNVSSEPVRLIHYNALAPGASFDNVVTEGLAEPLELQYGQDGLFIPGSESDTQVSSGSGCNSITTPVPLFFAALILLRALAGQRRRRRNRA
jgi:hypothetical protein